MKFHDILILKAYYAANIEQDIQAGKEGCEIASFLDSYPKQVEVLLSIVASCRKGDWEGYLAAAEAQVKYIFVHDLFHCTSALGSNEEIEN